jgi:hypothetical protein
VLLGAVVQVALEPSPRLVGRSDDTRSRIVAAVRHALGRDGSRGGRPAIGIGGVADDELAEALLLVCDRGVDRCGCGAALVAGVVSPSRH